MGEAMVRGLLREQPPGVRLVAASDLNAARRDLFAGLGVPGVTRDNAACVAGADIVINGCMPSSGCTAVPQTMSPIECLSVYCADLPSVGVKVTGNYVRVTLLSRLIALAVLLT